MQKTPVGVTILIGLIFLLLSLNPIFVSAQSTNSPSGLVVGEDEKVVISGPEYSVKGDVQIKEGGSLHIRNTDFQILQKQANEFQIELENSGELRLENSSLNSEKDIDLDLERKSKIEILDSSVDLPGEMSGPADSIKIKDSEVKVNKANVEADNFEVENSSIEGERWLISSPDFTSKSSVFDAGTTFHSNTLARSYGSLFDKIETNQGARVEVYGKISVNVKDGIGIPIKGAQLSIERAGTDYRFDAETGKDGEWSDHLLSEVIEPEGSIFFGNYIIRCSLEGREIEKTITLPPIEKRKPDKEIEELETRLNLKFSQIVSDSGYYDSSDFDFYVEGTTTQTIETYPNEGIDTFIQQGNIFLEESGQLVLDKDSSMKVLQKDENYRVELRDGSKLELKENSSMMSDRNLNFYLYDNSTLSLDSGELNVGSIVMRGSSTIKADDARIHAHNVCVDGKKLELTDSILDSKTLSVDSKDVALKNSKLDTENTVKLEGDEFDVKSLESATSIKFESEKEEISVTDVKAPEIIPEKGLTINRKWFLKVNIYNGHDRLVPSVDLQVYRQGAAEKILVEDVFVKEGKNKIAVESEIITRERSQFIGNYILEANKSINGETVESETTMVAVDKNVEAGVKFKEDFPYSIAIDADLPSNLEPGESFSIEGRAVYDGVDLQVENATVELVLVSGEETSWNTTTDEMGRFEIKGEAPSSIGAGTISLRVHDKNLMMESERTGSLRIDTKERSSIQHLLFETTLGRFFTVLIIFALIILAYKVSTTPMERQRPTTSNSNDVLRWSEKISKEK